MLADPEQRVTLNHFPATGDIWHMPHANCEAPDMPANPGSLTWELHSLSADKPMKQYSTINGQCSS